MSSPSQREGTRWRESQAGEPMSPDEMEAKSRAALAKGVLQLESGRFAIYEGLRVVDIVEELAAVDFKFKVRSEEEYSRWRKSRFGLDGAGETLQVKHNAEDLGL